MITLKESAGDIKLCKFMILLSDQPIEDSNKNYDASIPGYVFVEDYWYSTIDGIGTTEHRDNPWYAVSDNYITHQAIVDMIPEDIKKSINQKDWLAGRIDYYPHSWVSISTHLFGSQHVLSQSIIHFVEELSKRYNSKFDITKYIYALGEYEI